MKRSLVFLFVIISQLSVQGDDIYSYAQSRSQDLRMSVYITAHDVVQNLSDDTGRREAISLMRSHGMSKAFLEFYRGGLVVDKALLETNRVFFEKNGIRAVGGIATVPGPGFGVHQEARLGWFNWQNQKTQNDLTAVMKMAASVFDEIIVDDFVCTGDTSAESVQAKGTQSWSQYRRDLLTRMASQALIEPARSVRPDIWMIIKYPQWYDRFHLFGYDIPRKSALFDQVWVGTETRGASTQRYGFVQPYEGYVNYRWIKSVSAKTLGAWFDHGDCTAQDFIDQAYMSVLAGAKELTFFSYGPFIEGHPGHHLLRTQWCKLADLAAAVDPASEIAVYGYKPANHDAGGDLYIFDYLGMLGIPFAPTAQWPANAHVLFLPTQAAGDQEVEKKIQTALQQNRRVILTSGFLYACGNKRLLDLAGVTLGERKTITANTIQWAGREAKLEIPVKLAGTLVPTKSRTLMSAVHDDQSIPLLLERSLKKGRILVLNTHTFSQADFDQVDEVLLAPNKLGLLSLPQASVDYMRNCFVEPLAVKFSAPARVTCQSMGRGGWFIQNFNDSPAEILFQAAVSAKDGWTGQSLAGTDGIVRRSLAGRERLWIK